MTVTSTTAKVQYSPGGSDTSFSTAFTFELNADVVVTLTDSAGIETTWVRGTQYELTGAGAAVAGTVTVNTSPTDYTPASGTTLTIKREPALTQITSLALGGPLPSTALEDAVDRVVHQIQSLDERLDRTMMVPATENTNPAAMPTKTDRANKYLTFDSAGDPTATDAATASGTSVTATGTTTARLLAERFADIYNVLDFGATGDNTTDDTAAIQACIDAAWANNPPSVGATVWFPQGSYFISSPLVIKSDTALLGAGGQGMRNTRLRATSDITMIKTEGTSGTAYEGCTIKGLYLDRQVAGCANPHINIINPVWATLEDVYTLGSASQVAGDVSGVWITNNGYTWGTTYAVRMTRLVTNNGGVKIDGVTDCSMIDCDIWCTYKGTYALEMQDAASCNFFQTDFISGTAASVYSRDSGSASRSYTNSFINCTFSDGYLGTTDTPNYIDIINGRRVRITDCAFGTCRGVAIKLEDCYGAKITGCNFYWGNLGTRDTDEDDNTGAGGPYGDIEIIADAQSRQDVLISGNVHWGYDEPGKPDLTTLSKAVLLTNGDSAPSGVVIRDERMAGDWQNNYADPPFDISAGTAPIVFKDCPDSSYGTGNKVVYSFYQDNVAANQSNVILATHAGTMTGRALSYAGSIVAISVRTYNARSAGTLTVEAAIDGTGVGLTAVFDASSTFESYTTVLPGTYTFSANDMLTCLITTDAGWLPTNADITVDVIVEY